MSLALLVAIIAGFVTGWQAHRFYLRRLHKVSVRIRKVQQGKRWWK